MSLTINHNNGKFTCDFTSDGETSVQINSASPIKVNVDITGLGDQESNRDNKDTAEHGEVTSSAPEELSAEAPEEELAEAEKYRSENMDSSTKAPGINGAGTYVEDSPRIKDHTRNWFGGTK